ncbi:MAG: DUF455 family protein [Bdellovibrionota bacterium]
MHKPAAQWHELHVQHTKEAVITAPDWFTIRNVREKIAELPAAISHAMNLTQGKTQFDLGRDVRVVSPSQLPDKPGLMKAEGQGRLLHDLASIELQAMELATRSLFEYPDAPAQFRNELADLALGEGRHLALCLDAMEDLGFPWGTWDVHSSLWNAVSNDDTLLDRILIVHRYLEGSGLDAGESILRRMKGVKALRAKPVVETIMQEEVDHVLFGSRWYHTIAKRDHVDAEKDFSSRIARIAQMVPRRERIAVEVRKLAGFNDFEIAVLEENSRQLSQQSSIRGH